MLSRVAERIYWMGRYIERAESTARLVSAYMSEILDLPKGIERGWGQLLYITASEERFFKRYQNVDERNTIKFLLADDFNPSSILTCLAATRENVRTTRDRLPIEAWENANELYRYAKNNVQKGIARRERFYFLKTIVSRCQQITGLLAGTMSHDDAYSFARVGRNLERTDMSTRIVDSAVALLIPRKHEPAPFDNILWVNVLKSLSAYQMYRLHVRRPVEGEAVVRYLLQDTQYPRAVGHTVNEVVSCLYNLPRNDGPLRSAARLQRRIKEADIADMDLRALHAFIDELQLGLAALHESIQTNWFSFDAAQSQSQSAA